LEGLAIDSIYGDLTFYQAASMSNINGLSELVYVGGKVTFNRTGIRNITSLSNLTEIGGLTILSTEILNSKNSMTTNLDSQT